MNPRRILAYGVLVALAAGALAAISPSVFSLLDLRIYDAMLRAARTRPASGRVAIVAIDDRSLKEIGQWPWPRDVVARLIDRIRSLGARVVAIDMLLAEPDRFERSGEPVTSDTDAALASALSEGRVVMSYALTFGPDAATDRRCVLHPITPALLEGRDGRSPTDQLFHATGVVCSLPALTRSAGSSGYLNASPDRDGVLRRVPLLMEFGGTVYPSLALAAVLKATGPQRLTLAALAGDRTSLTMDDLQTRLDAQGTLLIRFRGRRGTYPHVPAADVLNGRVPAGFLQNRLVFVGATALGVQDVVSTPVDSTMPGIEVHATAADTLLQGDSVPTPPYWRTYELAATVVFVLIAVAIVLVAGFLTGVLAALALLALLWWATFVGVNTGHIFLSPVFPTVGLVLLVSVLTVARLRHERSRADEERARRERAHQFTVQSLTSLMEARDSATGQHARRTQEYAHLLATRLAALPRFRQDLTPERVELIAQLAPLHDIGKVGVRDAVLNKPGALSRDELDEIRRHPEFGHETIAKAERLSGGEGDEALLQLAKDIIHTHHERWDGLGYPRGLKGEEIPVAGRIVAVVDVYDALSQSRTYRPSLTHEEAVSTIVAGRGTHFDPDIVDAFLAVSEQFRQLALTSRDDAEPSNSATPTP